MKRLLLMLAATVVVAAAVHDPAEGPKQYFGQQVQVTGIITEGNGVTGLQIESATAL